MASLPLNATCVQLSSSENALGRRQHRPLFTVHLQCQVLGPSFGRRDVRAAAMEHTCQEVQSGHAHGTQVRRLMAALRTAYGRPKGSRDGDPTNALRTATAIEASRSLLAIWRADSERIEAFLAEDGGVVIVELLQEPCSEQVRHACNKPRFNDHSVYLQTTTGLVSPYVHICAI